jgi:hypothetical protein
VHTARARALPFATVTLKFPSPAGHSRLRVRVPRALCTQALRLPLAVRAAARRGPSEFTSRLPAQSLSLLVAPGPAGGPVGFQVGPGR